MPKNRKIDTEYLATRERHLTETDFGRQSINLKNGNWLTDKIEKDLTEEEILRIALLVSGSIIPMIVEDEFEDPIP